MTDYDLARPDPGQSTSAQDLTRARAEAAELTRLLLDARTDRDQWKADAERTMATLHDVALDLQRTKRRLNLLTKTAMGYQPEEDTPDALDGTAMQVRLGDRDDSTVHDLAASWADPHVGRTYRTRCQHVMTAAEGAVLTTRPSDCGPCWRGGR